MQDMGTTPWERRRGRPNAYLVTVAARRDAISGRAHLVDLAGFSSRS